MLSAASAGTHHAGHCHAGVGEERSCSSCVVTSCCTGQARLTMPPDELMGAAAGGRCQDKRAMPGITPRVGMEGRTHAV